MKKKDKLTFIKELSSDEAFVGMINFRDEVIICSTKSVYTLKDGKLHKQILIEGEPEMKKEREWLIEGEPKGQRKEKE